MKDWKNDSRHETFDTADARRTQLLAETPQGLLVKVKRMNSDGSFIVKKWYDRVKEEKAAVEEADGPPKRGRPKTKAQRRALREKRKRDRAPQL